MIRQALLLALATLALAVTAISCGKKPKREVILLEGHTSLSISFDVPTTGELDTFSEICEGRQMFLVSIDTDADPDWEWRFAVGTGGALHGCPAGLCADPTIQAHVGSPRRVMVEGLDVAPEDYASGPHDVVCRGIADETTGMGEISSLATGTAGQIVIEAEIPLLRPGRLNGLFTAANIGAGTEASGLDPDAAFDVRTPHGGAVILAGGNVPPVGMVDTIWAFEPWEIGMRTLGTLPGPRIGLSMVPFHHQGSEPALLLAAGERPYDVTQNSGNPIGQILFPDGTLTLIADTMAVARRTLNVHRFERDGDEVVVFLAGCEYGVPGTFLLDGYEYFSATGETCGETGPSFCRPNPASGNGAFGCSSVSAHFENAFGEPHIAIGGGSSATDRTMFVFDLLEDQFAAAPDLSETVWRGAMLQVSPNLTHVIGGGYFIDGSPDGAVMRTRMGAFVDGVWNPDTGPGLALPRWRHALAPLADGRLLIVGGERDRTPSEPIYPARPLKSLEVLEPGTSGTFSDGVPRLLAIPGEQCVTGSNGGCVLMSQYRPEPFAETIVGSDTWLNGAVLLGGGASDFGYNALPTGFPPELFVPAYECASGTVLPRSYVGAGPAAGLDVCDLARDPALLPLTDPSAP